MQIKPRDSALEWSSGGRRFESDHPDHTSPRNGTRQSLHAALWQEIVQAPAGTDQIRAQKQGRAVM